MKIVTRWHSNVMLSISIMSKLYYTLQNWNWCLIIGFRYFKYLSELFLRKYFPSTSLQLFSLIRRVQYDIFGTSIDQSVCKDFCVLAISTSYRTVPSAIWQRVSHIFNLFHEPLDEWNNCKIWETRKIIVIFNETAMKQLVYC